MWLNLKSQIRNHKHISNLKLQIANCNPSELALAPALLILLLGAAGCAPEGQSNAAQQTTVRVQTVQVEKKDLAQTIEMPGTVEGFESADLYAKVGGYLARINVDIGDRVKGPVAQIGDSTLSMDDRENVRRLVMNAGGWTPDAGFTRSVADSLKQFENHPQAALLLKLTEGASNMNEVLDRLLGQPLALLDIPEMKSELKQKLAGVQQALADVDQARAAVEQAKAYHLSAQASFEESQTERAEKESHRSFREVEFDRVRQLVSRGSLQRKKLDEARFQTDAAKAAVRSVSARVRTAEAELAAAKANITKAEKDLKSVEARVDVARAVHERVETLLQYGVIRAPFSGVVTCRMVDPGDFIQPAEGNSAAKALLRVARTDKVRVILDLPMNEVRWLNIGDRATLDRVNVLPGQTFEGEVSRFAPGLDRGSRMMRVEVDLPNTDGRLMPGYYGYVKLWLEEFKQTPVVPSSALLGATEKGADKQGKLYVFVVKDGKCAKTPIQTNYNDGENVGVDVGLRGGEQVVQSGVGQLADGQEVIAVALK